jgi:hypothetical protein
MTADFDDVLAADDVVGVLTREVRVRLVNISASGCLVESGQRLEPGTAGRLRVVVEGETYGDDVRVARVQQRQGAGSTWQLGAEFLWTSPPGPESLRRVVSRLRQTLTKQVVEIELTTRPM